MCILFLVGTTLQSVQKFGAYACKHGAAETARHFSKELRYKVHETTVKST